MILNEYDERDKEIERLYEDIERLSKLLSISERQVSHLEQQLKEANEVINDDLCEANSCFAVGRIRKYKDKWGVK